MTRFVIDLKGSSEATLIDAREYHKVGGEYVFTDVEGDEPCPDIRIPGSRVRSVLIESEA